LSRLGETSLRQESPINGTFQSPKTQQTTQPETTRLRMGVGTKRKASYLQKDKALKRPHVEEGDDFLLNEISLAA
jgi:hypothetical protein